MVFDRRAVVLKLPQVMVNLIRESIDHHLKALVWRKNRIVEDENASAQRDRLQDEINQCNAALNEIEKQIQNQ